jgi:hypothetical protein
MRPVLGVHLLLHPVTHVAFEQTRRPQVLPAELDQDILLLGQQRLVPRQRRPLGRHCCAVSRLLQPASQPATYMQRSAPAPAPATTTRRCALYSLTPYFVTGGILLLFLHGDTPAAVMFNTGSRKGPAVSICFIEVLSRDSNAFDQLRPAQISSGATWPPIWP